ncbi:hypothetical protein [Sulfitobacter sp. SH24]|uniref:hypothetical protein n=1 Tax=Sulfitobacter sp. SH24 TaxID=3421173 RepID=UPI003F50430B
MKNLTTAAAGPVTASEFKRSIHMLEVETDDDVLITDLIATATAVVETGTAHPMAATDYEFDLPLGTWETWWFPVRPVTTLKKVEWLDGENVWQGGDAAGAYVLRNHDEPRLVIPADLAAALQDARAARVTANVGGAPLVQQRQAVIMLVKEWRDAGIALEGVEPPKLSWSIQRLIDQVRYRRPQVTG